MEDYLAIDGCLVNEKGNFLNNYKAETTVWKRMQAATRQQITDEFSRNESSKLVVWHDFEERSDYTWKHT